LITSAINCITSFIAGFVVFSMLGYMWIEDKRWSDMMAFRWRKVVQYFKLLKPNVGQLNNYLPKLPNVSCCTGLRWIIYNLLQIIEHSIVSIFKINICLPSRATVSTLLPETYDIWPNTENTTNPAIKLVIQLIALVINASLKNKIANCRI